jgi:hypothetical protein
MRLRRRRVAVVGGDVYGTLSERDRERRCVPRAPASRREGIRRLIATATRWRVAVPRRPRDARGVCVVARASHGAKRPATSPLCRVSGETEGGAGAIGVPGSELRSQVSANRAVRRRYARALRRQRSGRETRRGDADRRCSVRRRPCAPAHAARPAVGRSTYRRRTRTSAGLLSARARRRGRVIVATAGALRAVYILSLRPRSRRDYPPNLSILLSGGKETNQDSPSSGERTGKSPALNPAAVPVAGNVAFGSVRHPAVARCVQVLLERGHLPREGARPVATAAVRGRASP